jgi:trehalose 6-phosphate phosphatase
MTVPDDLAAAVREFASHARVLVGLDFDGVLAPFAPRPELAAPLPRMMPAVRRLGAAKRVAVALVSGRSADDLRVVSGVTPDERIAVVGSHGAEIELPGRPGPPRGLDPAADALLDRVTTALREITAAYDGAWVETKPTGAVLHTRAMDRALAEVASERAVSGPGGWAGVSVTPGKEVVELSVSTATKGIALQQLRDLCDAQAVLYVGDDVTDERAFEVLRPDEGDIGVKVGDGETAAAYRLAGPADVLELLELLAACSQPR